MSDVLFADWPQAVRDAVASNEVRGKFVKTRLSINDFEDDDMVGFYVFGTKAGCLGVLFEDDTYIFSECTYTEKALFTS